MVAVRTGFPSPMQPMGGFPSTTLPAGQTPVPASVPPMPLAGFPPPPVKPPMAQQVSNAPRRRRFGDSLEGMLGRNIFATQQKRPLPMPQQQQRMVAPGTPMMRTPTPRPMQMGGAVPRQTTIAGQPHGLAYINQDEEALLRSFGGSGIAGPGGIPSYPPQGVTSFGGASDAPKTFDSGYKPITTNYKGGKDDDDDDKPSSYSAFDDDYEDFTPTSDQLNQQLSDAGQTNITTNFSNVNYDTTGSGQDFTTAAQADTDVSGAEFVAAGGLGSVDSGSPASPPPVTLGSTEAVTTYTDMLGNTHSSAADRDRANLAIQQQMYGSGNQAARNVQQELYKKYAEQFPEGKRMEGDSEELGRMGADVYLKYAPEINELLGPQGLPNQPFNLPFSFSGIEGITPRGSDTAPDAPDRDTTSPNTDYPAKRLRFNQANFLNSGLFADPDVGLGPGSGYPDMSMTAIPGATTPMGYFPEDPGTGFPSGGTTAAGKVIPPLDKGKEKEYQFSYQAGSGKDKDKDDKSDPRLKLIPKDKDGNPVVDLEVLKNTGLLEIYLENLANPDERLNRTPQVPGAAQTQLLTDAFNMASKDPNFLEQVIGKVVRNLTLGAFDPNERNREIADKILKAYADTGTFAYDSEKDALDLSDTPEGRANFEKLQEMSAGDGQEIGTIGVYDAEGNIVGNKNTYVNTKDGVVVENIFDKLSSGDDDDDGGSDTGTDTGVDTDHTVDKDGNIVCNEEGYIYNPETKKCEPPKEEEDKDPTINVVRGEDFDDVLKRVVVAAPDVAPISANVQPMQEGGMAGLNRAADNFLKALAG